MVFSSYLFLFYFLPLALALYYASPQRGRHLLLTLVSYLFYGWANPWFVLLMLFSTVVDYVCGMLIVGKIGRTPPNQEGRGRAARGRAPGRRSRLCSEEGVRPSERQRRFALVFSIVTNLALLGFFKYVGFVQGNLNLLLEMFGREALDVYTIALPVGISFYTFQSMSYSIDLYRGHARPASSFIDFACYVSLFPQLVAGPIVRYHEVAEQLRHRTHTEEKFARGVLFFALGFGKKILLANPMGEVADAAFGAAAVTPLQAWAGVLAYAFQIYFDFSGYSDMAVGLGLMLGFEFPRNFAYPYRADSITDFWRRWHISLSTWLRDYLYIPLGGNRKGVRRTYVNLATVMILGGLWHGAEWMFVIWGSIHGAMLILERLAGKQSFYQKAPRALRVAFTFVIVLITWVFFRATDVTAAFAYLGSMFGLGSAGAPSALLNSILFSPDHLLIFAVCAMVVWLYPDTWELVRPVTRRKAVAAMAVLGLAAVTMFAQTYNPFLYFRF